MIRVMSLILSISSPAPAFLLVRSKNTDSSKEVHDQKKGGLWRRDCNVCLQVDLNLEDLDLK